MSCPGPRREHFVCLSSPHARKRTPLPKSYQTTRHDTHTHTHTHTQRPSAGSMSTTQLITMMSILGMDYLGPEMSNKSPKIVYHAFVKTNTIWKALPRLCSKYPPQKRTHPLHVSRKVCPGLASAPPFRISFSAETIERSVAIKSVDLARMRLPATSIMMTRNITATRKRSSHSHAKVCDTNDRCKHNARRQKE